MRADLIILDGRHLLWRTADAFSQLSAEVDGEERPTGGLYGFLACAVRVKERYRGRVVVVWEGKTNWRKRLYPSYKTRERTPDEQERIAEMAEQEYRLVEMLQAAGVNQYRGVDCEADDVIALLARRAAAADVPTVIYSGDSDLRQLVGGSVYAVAPESRHDRTYDADAVEEKHGVPPRLLAALKALSGDSSDLIPGVPGVGAKTAALLLNHYGGLKPVLRAAIRGDDDWPSTPRFARLVREHAGDVILYYRLTHLTGQARFKRIAPRRSQSEVIEQLKRYKFRSLAAPSELAQLMSLGRK